MCQSVQRELTTQTLRHFQLKKRENQDTETTLREGMCFINHNILYQGYRISMSVISTDKISHNRNADNFLEAALKLLQ